MPERTAVYPHTAHRVHIPEIYHDKSSHRVLTMEFVHGGEHRVGAE